MSTAPRPRQPKLRRPSRLLLRAWQRSASSWTRWRLSRTISRVAAEELRLRLMQAQLAQQHLRLKELELRERHLRQKQLQQLEIRQQVLTPRPALPPPPDPARELSRRLGLPTPPS